MHTTNAIAHQPNITLGDVLKARSHMRALSGDVSFYADPSAPLVLLSGEIPVYDAQAGAVRCLENGGPKLPWVLDLAQAWWEAQDDARALMGLLGRIGNAAGRDSPEHRRTVLVACLCSRTAMHLEERRQKGELATAALEAWAWGDDSVDVHAAATQLTWGYAIDASDASYAAFDAAASYAFFLGGDQLDTYEGHRRTHLRALCDLVRAAVPICPLTERNTAP